MYRIARCPCCGGTELDKFGAIVAPFIAAYVLHQKARPTTLLECAKCSFRFFEERYEEHELKRLYGRYRGPEYFRARNKNEPWYSSSLNASIGGDDTQIGFRRNYLDEMLSEELAGGAPVRSLLDYGGDRGQFIPTTLSERRYVYEMSDVEPVAGVTRISSEQILKDETFDVIMLCHILEHSPDPLAILLGLRPLLRNEESVFLVEVPYERYDMHGALDRRWYRRWLQGVTQVGPILTVLDFYSTFARFKWNRVPPLGFVKLHEHINFFEVRSLTALLERAGLVVAQSKVITKRASSFGFEGVLLCTAKVP